MQDLVVQIDEFEYQKLFSSIKSCVEKGGEDIDRVVMRKRLKIGWQVGGLIENSLLKNKKYGDGLFVRLEKDILIGRRVLYRMHLFYKNYPKLPDDGLSWSHYQVLMGIKDKKSRKYFTNFTINNNLSTRDLILSVKKLKERNNILEGKTKIINLKVPVLGKLFCYSLVEFEYLSKIPKIPKIIYVDCGFNIFKKVETDIEVGKVVQSIQGVKGDYSFQELASSSKKLYTYKAYLERVVDGDTIRVIVDLGFGIYHREILRLREVYAAEQKTKEGQLATKKLVNILKEISFLVIKTNKIDIYGRYVADVFLEGKQYLNQLLLKIRG